MFNITQALKNRDLDVCACTHSTNSIFSVLRWAVINDATGDCAAGPSINRKPHHVQSAFPWPSASPW